MKRLGTTTITVLLIMAFALPLIAITPTVQGAIWNVGATRTYSDIDGIGSQVADGDTINVNAGGRLTLDVAWLGSDGSRDISGIVVNLDGIHIQDPGTRLDINTATAILVNEGGQWRSLGTTISRCIIRGESTASAAHKINVAGGLMFLDYTDVDTFYLFNVAGGECEMYNSTITDVQFPLYFDTGNGHFTLVNTDITQNIASRWCSYTIASAFASITAIDCAFTTTTDNFLVGGIDMGRYIFAGCTYQGLAIESDDIALITYDIDIRIYEKTLVTVSNNIAGVGISLNHSSLDPYGMLYDSTNYLKTHGYLSYPPTNTTGNTTLYLLNKSAYWRSGLAIASRTWVNWSNNGGVEPTNDEWNITVSALGYVTNSTTVWSGTNATIDMDIAGAVIERANQTIRTYLSNVTTCANLSSRFAFNTTVYGNGTITFTNAQTNVNVNISVMNSTNVWITDLLPTTTQSFSAGITMNLTEIAGDVINWTSDEEGEIHFNLNTWKAGEVENFNTTEDFLISNITSTTYWVNETIVGGHKVNYACFFTWDLTPGTLEVVFTDESVTRGTMIEYYTWDFGDGSALGHTANPTHTYEFPGDYNVTLRIRNTRSEIEIYTTIVRATENVVSTWMIMGSAILVFAGLLIFGIMASNNAGKKAVTRLLLLVLTVFVVLLVFASQVMIG